ncbi:MAG TPA: cupin domain-containing protein [bacterium]|nr:cupin domain-containing protein [bacterium]
MAKVSLSDMAALIKNYWAPLDLFQVNNVKIRLVKIKGKYHWHKHNDEDELFIVLKGKLTIHFKNGNVVLHENEGYVVSKGTEHQTEAKHETLVMLVEPETIVTPGN